MTHVKVASLLVLLFMLTGFYVSDQRVIEDGVCAGFAGTFSCKVGNEIETVTMTETVRDAERELCAYHDQDDNSETLLQRIDGNLYLSQTTHPTSKKPIEYNFIEPAGNGDWNLYVQDARKSEKLLKKLQQKIQNESKRIREIIEREGDISVSPDQKSGTEKLSGPNELILLVLTLYDKSVLTKVGVCRLKQ